MDIEHLSSLCRDFHLLRWFTTFHADYLIRGTQGATATSPSHVHDTDFSRAKITVWEFSPDTCSRLTANTTTATGATTKTIGASSNLAAAATGNDDSL